MGRWLTVALVVGLAPPCASAADLTDAAIRGYEAHFEAARRAFIARATTAPDTRTERDAARANRGVVQPGSGDGIVSNADSLVHHWRGEIFLPGVTLDRVIALSQAYAEYPQIFKPVRAVTVLPPAGDALHVRFRMKASGGGLSATLDVRSRIRWVRVDERRAYVVTTSEEIREVANAGGPTERLLPEGHDSGYLWRAASMTGYVAGNGGVWMVMETVGLSRPFPPLLGWVIEPVVRRVGRGSVGDSMQEFAQALSARGSKLAP
jgi:hypothetical protein